jgi:hypothetical protein
MTNARSQGKHKSSFVSLGPHYAVVRISSPPDMCSLRRGADKSLAFPIFLLAAQQKEFFSDGLKKLEQRSHKCVELRGEYVE